MAMTGASIGAIIFDTPTILFVFSASARFLLGAWGFYRDAVRNSLRAVDGFPSLMQLQLDAKSPHLGYDTWEGCRFRSVTCGRSWAFQSMLTASWMTANRAVEVSLFVRHDTELLLLYCCGNLIV